MSEKYRILIAEDDVLISAALKNHLTDLGHDVIGVVSTEQDAMRLLKELPDFCFLDIRMHGKDTGFEIARHIRGNYNMPFLFLTSFADEKTVRLASEFHPSGYLLKPFREADIFTSLEVAMAKFKNGREGKVEIRDGNSTFYVHPDEIIYIKADNIYVEIQTKSRRFTERISLDKFSERLPEQFVKCHRSYVINKAHIDGISTSSLQVGGYDLPLSRTYRQRLKK